MAMGVEPLVGASEEISGSYKVCDPCAEAFAALRSTVNAGCVVTGMIINRERRIQSVD